MGVFDDIIEQYGDKTPPAAGASQAPVTYGDPHVSGPEAYARFSRAPINFLDIGSLMKRIGSKSIWEGPSYSTGTYHPEDKDIIVTVPPSSDVDDVLSTILHEDVHGVLNNAGLSGRSLPFGLRTAPPDVSNYLGGARRPSSVDLFDSWFNSNRSGSFNTEIPAYLTAYRPGEIKNVTKPGAESWVTGYANTLPPATRQQILRMGKLSRESTPLQPQLVK